MKYTIITAVYNNSYSVDFCINSLLNQSYSNIEYIIIDGASKDGSIEKIKSLKNEIEAKNIKFIFKSESDHGIYDALNKGISLSKGDIIGILHSDDIFAYQDVLKDIANIFEMENVKSVYSDLEYVDRYNTDDVLRYWKSGEFKYGNILKGWMPPHPTFFIKKEIFEKYGIYDLNFKIAADYDLILRFLYKHKITTAYLPKVTVKMRAGGASNKSISNIIQKSKEDYLALKKNEIPFPLKVLFLKNFSKISQFFVK